MDVVLLALSNTFQLSFTALTLQFFPGYISVMIPMFHCTLFRSSPSITTTSPTLTSDSFLLCFKLCLSLNDIRYSLLHLFQVASLHFWMYFWHFRWSLSSIFSVSSFGIISCWSKTSEFDVKSGNFHVGQRSVI